MTTKEDMSQDSMTPGPMRAPAPGELWECPLGAAGVLGWVVIKVHPDDADLFLVVPVDTEDAVGPRDVAVPQVASDGVTGRLVLRGDWSRWACRDDFWFCASERAVPREWRVELLTRIQESLGKKRESGGSVVREEALDWAEHADWIRETLAPADADFERWEKRESFGETATIREAGPEPVEDTGALAAAGLSEMAALAREAPEGASAEMKWEVFNLFVSKRSSGAESKTFVFGSGDAAYFELDAELAPRDAFVLDAKGGRTFLRWNKTLSRRWRSQALELSDGSLRVVVAGSPVVDVKIAFEPRD